MRHFVPYQKLSKQAQRERNAVKRRTWDISPTTRIKESQKVYNRNKQKHNERRQTREEGW